MTYLESYLALDSVESIKAEAKKDADIAIFFGANPDRLKAIEDAMNTAIEIVKKGGA